MRGLSDTFINALKLETGHLYPVLKQVKSDATLCLEIRENYINIYYRGGNILKVEEKDKFYAWFDRKYLDESRTRISKELPTLLATLDDVNKWLDVVPFLKYEMDLWFNKYPKDEREFQQLLLRENNFGKVAKSTDYFICDIEYANTHGRFDLVAVHWPSSAAERKNNKNLGLSFIEMKYLDKALTRSAGLKGHIKNINNFLKNRDNIEKIKDEMKKIFNQKQELKLINNQKLIESFSADKPEYILALANHDPSSSILRDELKNLPPCPDMELKVAVSNFMGYGLYDQNIYPLDVFLSRFKVQI